jgi:hypothetical protein
MEKNNLLEGLDTTDINKVIEKFVELNEMKKELTKATDELKIKVKIFMKEKRWNDYASDDNISVKITRIEQTSIDKDKLKMLLTKQQLDSISNYKTIEKIMITTKQQRDRIKRFLDGKQNL